MRVKFKMDVTWTDRTCSKGEVIDLGDALALQFIAKGFVEPIVKEPEQNNDSNVVKIVHRSDNMGGNVTRGKRSVKG